MFNEYQWHLYLNAGGREVAEMFERNLTDDFSEEYAEKISELHRSYCPEKGITDGIENDLLHLFSDLIAEESMIDDNYILDCFFIEEGEYTINSALDYIFNSDNDNGELISKDLFKYGLIPYMSTALTMQIPDLFVPYYFQCNFNVLEKICNEFDIDLPEIPIKRDYKGRFYYYGKLCEALLDFRNKHSMTPFEFCAFLYDYAPKVIGGIDSYIIRDVPEPTSAFFIGGESNDAFLSDDKDAMACWQCSPEAKPGDYAVMYLKTPISSVDSVWRCVSEGFIDPFAYYYRMAYIAKPKRIKRIAKDRLEKDRIFKQLSIVRKNMQGINGVELKPSEYNHLMDLAKASELKLTYSQPVGDVELLLERDVENQLIKPLLKKLKYKDTDYVRQLHIEVGNHNTILIPDFLLLPDKTPGCQKAFAVIEAKFDIPNHKAFEDAKIQARSYARQVLAKYSVIASKDKIYISSCDDDFSNDFFVKTWEELENPDKFSQLFKIIGKGK